MAKIHQSTVHAWRLSSNGSLRLIRSSTEISVLSIKSESSTLDCEGLYYYVRDQFTVVNGIFMLDALFIFPQALRRKVMLADEGHAGQVFFREALQQHVWGPGLKGKFMIFTKTSWIVEFEALSRMVKVRGSCDKPLKRYFRG